MAAILLTELQRQNLLAFLSRVQLVGHEAVALVEIMGALQNPISNGEEVSTLKPVEDS